MRRTWAYPAYPDEYLDEVVPHLQRFVVAEGVQLRKADTLGQANTRALYAVLVKDDAQCPDVTAGEVATALGVPARSMGKWRAKVNALRNEAADGAALLELSSTPSASAPPSPPAEAPSAIEALASSLSALQPWRLRNSDVTVAGVECRGTMIASRSGSALRLRFWHFATSDIIRASCSCLWHGSCFPGRLQQPAGGVAM